MDIMDLIAKHSKPHLAAEPGMVKQVWEDGEVTLQKSGDLLWQRSLHMIEAGFSTKLDIDLFPHKTSNGHGYIFTDDEGAAAIRAAIRDIEARLKALNN
jgi:hypothetical protein